jgi:hypothetical protein
MKLSWPDLRYYPSSCLGQKKTRIPSISIASVLSDIRTGFLPKTNEKRYSLSWLVRVGVYKKLKRTMEVAGIRLFTGSQYTGWWIINAMRIWRGSAKLWKQEIVLENPWCSSVNKFQRVEDLKGSRKIFNPGNLDRLSLNHCLRQWISCSYRLRLRQNE